VTPALDERAFLAVVRESMVAQTGPALLARTQTQRLIVTRLSLMAVGVAAGIALRVVGFMIVGPLVALASVVGIGIWLVAGTWPDWGADFEREAYDPILERCFPGTRCGGAPMTLEECNAQGLFRAAERLGVESAFTARARGVPVDIQVLRAVGAKLHERTLERESSFHGILVRIHAGLPHRGRTALRLDLREVLGAVGGLLQGAVRASQNLPSDMAVVPFAEDPAFERRYEVLSSDAASCRALLVDPVRRALLAAPFSRPTSLAVVDGRIHLACGFRPGEHNPFLPSTFGPILRYRAYRALEAALADAGAALDVFATVRT